MQLLNYPIPHNVALSDYVTFFSMIHRYVTTKAKSCEHRMTEENPDLNVHYEHGMVFQIKSAIGLGMLSRLALKSVSSKIQTATPNLPPDLEKLTRGTIDLGVKMDKKCIEIILLEPPFDTTEMQDHCIELKRISLEYFCDSLRVCTMASKVFHSDLTLVSNLETLSSGMTRFFMRNVPKSLRGEYNRRKKPHFPQPLRLDCAGPSR